ncbi:hypothetical protein BN133_743 [Cronobacter dublinensis 582]|nr:hypothetical protein BN133_743 [Cronobacter dublinensis 582]
MYHYVDFCRVMTVVVHQHRRAGFTVHVSQRKLAQEIETTPGALEAFQRAQNGLVFNALFRRHRHRRRRIKRVMAARRVERHVQFRFVLTHQGKMPLRAGLTIISHTYIGIFAETISGNLTADARQQLADHRIVNTHHRTAIKRQVVQEVNKRLFQVLEVAMVRVHVVSFDIGDDGHHRLQMQERGVAFVGFGNQIPAVTETRMRPRRFHQPAVDESRVQPGFSINTRHHRGSRCLAMRTCDGDAVAKTHQLRQHLRAANHRNARLVGRHNFRVIRRNCAGDHDHARVQHVLRTVVEINRGAKRRQLLRDSVRRQIRPADLVAFVSQHFRNAAHTGAADANEVNVPDATHLGHDRTQFRQLLCIHSLKAFGKRHNIINSRGTNIIRNRYARATAGKDLIQKSQRSGMAAARARSAMSSSVARSHPFSVSLTASTVNCGCSRIFAAPAFSSGSAFQYCCLSLCWNGTNSAGKPAAAISLTVSAPERQTTTSAHAQ